MRDRSDRYRVQTVSPFNGVKKRIGSYLVEAGLLTTAQLDVALKDQKMTEEMTGTRMQLGEILAARGWIKEQTIEYLMQKVVLPERQVNERKSQETINQSQDTVRQQRQAPPRSASAGQMLPKQTQRVQAKSSEAIELPAAQPKSVQPSSETGANRATNQSTRREAPIAKPLPPVNSSDDAVNWVG
jgi:hypothetical protein